MSDRSIDVQLEENRGRTAGVKRDLESHEDICGVRYAEITAQHNLLREDIKGIKQTLIRFLIIALTLWVSVTGWALKSQWDMQAAATQTLIQMSAASHGSAQSGTLSAPVQTPPNLP